MKAFCKHVFGAIRQTLIVSDTVGTDTIEAVEQKACLEVTVKLVKFSQRHPDSKIATLLEMVEDELDEIKI